MSKAPEVELIRLEDVSPPGEIDVRPRRKRVRGDGNGRRPSGTKIQTQVPREWRKRMAEMAREQGVRESDVVRILIGRGLGEIA